ncbi:uncharacterized protein [Gossypium hirsutum]|uniref:Gag-Pol polyprotein n=1 Tax=Gossypium hirsutum TaxID=3635 RepID=A0A1U8PGU2_GOSHI|nr:uncharacterized protein LOC107958993 [Gossypium hirsutum]
MCNQFEDGLNEDIKLLVGILKLKEFVVLVDQAYKTKDLNKEKRQAETEARGSSKILTRKSYQSTSKKSKKYHDYSTTSAGYSSRDRGNARNIRPKCKYCNKSHFGECKMKSGACFRCGPFDHYLRDYLEKSEKDNIQTSRPSNTATRGRPPRNPKNVSSSSGVAKDSTVRFKAQAPARAYAIRTREDAFALDVITDTFSLIDIDVTALIDPGSTYLYVCMNLVPSKNLLVESTEFVVKVSNPLR